MNRQLAHSILAIELIATAVHRALDDGMREDYPDFGERDFEAIADTARTIVVRAAPHPTVAYSAYADLAALANDEETP